MTLFTSVLDGMRLPPDSHVEALTPKEAALRGDSGERLQPTGEDRLGVKAQR